MTWEIDNKKCVRCSACVGVCPKAALTWDEFKGTFCDSSKCVSCGICAKFCPVGAITVKK